MIKKLAAECREIVELAVNEGIIEADEDLAGACAVASFFLRKKLLSYGYKTDFYVAKAHNHCWLRYGDKILDITATQFGHKNKVVFKKGHIHEYYYTGYKVRNFKEEFAPWPEDQKPTKEKMECLNDLFYSRYASRTRKHN